jgi:Calcium binding
VPDIELDAVREERIKNEILADAEDKEDRAMGWFYYLEDSLNFPFNAKWAKKGRKGTAPEKDVEVLGMATEDECLRDMLVEVAEIGGKDEDVDLARLTDLKVLDADSETTEALNDWYYWVGRGYKF